jgi:hypothetical protein
MAKVDEGSGQSRVDPITARARALLHKIDQERTCAYAYRLDTVEQALRQAVADEREDCAKVAENYSKGKVMTAMDGPYAARFSKAIAQAIRQQGGCQHVWGIDGQHNNEYCKKCFVDKPPEGQSDE